MRIGASLFLIAVGAILTWAVTATVSGVDLNMIGVILMIVGAIGLVISLVMLTTRRRTEIVHRGFGPDGQPTRQSTTYVTPTVDEDQL